MGEAVIKILSAALICTLLSPLIRKSTSAELLKRICGVFMAAILLSCIRQIPAEKLWEPVLADCREVYVHTEAGEAQARRELEGIIKGSCEAYILDKAAQLGADISVYIRLSKEDVPVPESISISGTLSPYAKSELEKLLTEQMGIPGRDQHWIG